MKPRPHSHARLALTAHDKDLTCTLIAPKSRPCKLPARCTSEEGTLASIFCRFEWQACAFWHVMLTHLSSTHALMQMVRNKEIYSSP